MKPSNKTLDDLMIRHSNKIASWYKDLDGYWLTLHYGWQASPFSQVHTVHETTVKEVLASFRTVVPCTCLSCRTHGAQWEDYDMDTGEKVIRHGRQEDAKGKS